MDTTLSRMDFDLTQMLKSTEGKNARLDIKTTKNAKEILSRAAALNGMDLSSFVLAHSIEKALHLLEQHNVITLSTEGQTNFNALMDKKLKPTKAMEGLMKLPKLPTK